MLINVTCGVSDGSHEPRGGANASDPHARRCMQRNGVIDVSWTAAAVWLKAWSCRAKGFSLLCRRMTWEKWAEKEEDASNGLP